MCSKCCCVQYRGTVCQVKVKSKVRYGSLEVAQRRGRSFDLAGEERLAAGAADEDGTEAVAAAG